jgi:two-component system response regulator YesN
MSEMPWARFRMRVVGDVPSGERALEFLEANEVDLVLVDLAMPRMTGLELMRAAGQKHPRLHFVVLTFHDELDYVQEAMRLGAIDYIVKVQLEKERYEVVLRRIRARIVREMERAAAAGAGDAGPFRADVLYALAATGPSVDGAPGTEGVAATAEPGLEEVDDGLWLCPQGQVTDEAGVRASLEGRLGGRQDCVLLRVSGLVGEDPAVLRRALRRYRHEDLFYDVVPPDRCLHLSMDVLEAPRPAPGPAELAGLREAWLAAEWIPDDTRFEQLLRQTRDMRPPVGRLVSLMERMAEELNRLYASIAFGRLQPPPRPLSWAEVESWVRDSRARIVESVGLRSHNQEVAARITRAARLIQADVSGHLSAGDMARRVHMSRSYFNQCFRDILGKPFNRYVRYLRIEKAKAYLAQTTQSIPWIAQRSGYFDGRYFSRVFRQTTGMLPSKYRQGLRSDTPAARRPTR